MPNGRQQINGEASGGLGCRVSLRGLTKTTVGSKAEMNLHVRPEEGCPITGAI